MTGRAWMLVVALVLGGCEVNEKHATACLKACGIGAVEEVSFWACKCRPVAGALALPPVKP